LGSLLVFDFEALSTDRVSERKENAHSYLPNQATILFRPHHCVSALALKGGSELLDR
jgi:hypothetical protein